MAKDNYYLKYDNNIDMALLRHENVLDFIKRNGTTTATLSAQ